MDQDDDSANDIVKTGATNAALEKKSHCLERFHNKHPLTKLSRA